MPINGILKITPALIFLLASTGYLPARFESGPLPAQPPHAIGGGQVMLEVEVDTTGTVGEMVTLRFTPPYTDLLRETVSQWRFHPARETPGARAEAAIAVESHVLVVGLFRPSTFYGEPIPGEVPKDMELPSTRVPFPTSTASPRYPPTVVGSGGRVPLVELEVGDDGIVRAVRVIRSAPGFDSVSIEAARKWRFQPAERKGEAVSSFVYIVFGFREPVAPVKLWD